MVRSAAKQVSNTAAKPMPFEGRAQSLQASCAPSRLALSSIKVAGTAGATWATTQAFGSASAATTSIDVALLDEGAGRADPRALTAEDAARDVQTLVKAGADARLEAAVR